jgi:hypothetical protein
MRVGTGEQESAQAGVKSKAGSRRRSVVARRGVFAVSALGLMVLLVYPGDWCVLQVLQASKGCGVHQARDASRTAAAAAALLGDSHGGCCACVLLCMCASVVQAA